MPRTKVKKGNPEKAKKKLEEVKAERRGNTLYIAFQEGGKESRAIKFTPDGAVRFENMEPEEGAEFFWEQVKLHRPHWTHGAEEIENLQDNYQEAIQANYDLALRIADLEDDALEAKNIYTAHMTEKDQEIASLREDLNQAKARLEKIQGAINGS